MAGENVKFEVVGSGDKALGLLKKLTEGQDKMIGKFGQVAQASKRSAKAGEDGFGKVQQALGTVVTTLVGGFGVSAALTKVTMLTRTWKEGMTTLAREARTAGDEVLALAMLQEGGEARAAVVQAQTMAAPFTIKRGPAVNVVQALQSQLEDKAAGAAAAREVFILVGLGGVPIDQGLATVSAGIGAGVSPGEAARLAYAAGEVSAKSAADLSTIAAAIPFYATLGGPKMAYGVAAAISGTYTRELLSTHTRGVGIALGKREGPWGEYLATIPGAAEGDVVKMLRGLKKDGIETVQDLATVGLVEIRQAGPLAVLLKDLDAAARKIEAVPLVAADEQLIFKRRGAAEQDFPELQFQRHMGILDAGITADLGVPETEPGRRTLTRAMRRAIRKKARARAMIRGGHGWLVGSDQEASWWQWHLAGLLEPDTSEEPGIMGVYPTPSQFLRGPGPSKMRAEALDYEKLPVLEELQRQTTLLNEAVQGQSYAPEEPMR